MEGDLEFLDFFVGRAVHVSEEELSDYEGLFLGGWVVSVTVIIVGGREGESREDGCVFLGGEV